MPSCVDPSDRHEIMCLARSLLPDDFSRSPSFCMPRTPTLINPSPRITPHRQDAAAPQPDQTTRGGGRRDDPKKPRRRRAWPPQPNLPPPPTPTPPPPPLHPPPSPPLSFCSSRRPAHQCLHARERRQGTCGCLGGEEEGAREGGEGGRDGGTFEKKNREESCEI